jgi:hypothetical protein
MLSLGIIFLVMTIPLASLYLSTIFPSERFALLIFINTFHEFSVLPILGGLTTIIPQSLEIFLPSLKDLIVPVIVYNNADTNKLQILTDNKEKEGVYLWTHLESGKKYVNSAVNLSTRFKNYYSIYHLELNKTMQIYNALRIHGYSVFNLTILEFIDFIDLSKEESRLLIFSWE